MLTHQNSEDAETDLVLDYTIAPNKPTFFINQFIYIFNLGKSDVNIAVRNISIKKNNEMGIVKLPKGEWNNLRSIAIKMVTDIAIKSM